VDIQVVCLLVDIDCQGSGSERYGVRQHCDSKVGLKPALDFHNSRLDISCDDTVCNVNVRLCQSKEEREDDIDQQ